MLRSVKSRIVMFSIVLAVVMTTSLYLGYHSLMPTLVPKDWDEKFITLDEVTKGEPSYTMTLSHVKEMAQVAHPSGSQEIEQVRTYLKNQITRIGCQYTEELFMTSGEDFPTMEFKNYLVKLDAPNTDKGVLFVSHYDSTAGGPGAGDDLIGVGSILEALRLVTEKTTIENDMYFLFTDGEELNLLGADYFVKAHPEMKDMIKLVINVEARGNQGALFMFQTSEGNKNIIKMLNHSVDHVTAFSPLVDVYKTMPNDTDLTVFLENGYPGINFAVVDGGEHYHQDSDTIENLDRNTGYMYYKTVISLADYLSTSNLEQLVSDEDAVYFPFFKGRMVILSERIFQVFEIVLCIVSFLWIMLLFVLYKQIRKELLVTVLSVLVLTYGAVLFAFLEKKTAGLFLSGTLRELVPMLDLLMILLTVVLLIGVTLGVFVITKKLKEDQAMLVGIMLLLLVVSIILLNYFPSATYLFTIPLFILLLCSVIIFCLRNQKKLKFKFVVLGAILLIITTAMLYTPLIVMLYQAFFIELFYGYAILIALPCCIVASVAACVYKDVISYSK